MKTTTKLIVAICFSIVLGALLIGQSQKSSNRTISVEDAHAMIVTDTSIVVLDVRTPGEYNGELGHIQHSLLIPIKELETRLAEMEQAKGKTILAVCRSGRRSGQATEILTKNGYTVMNVEGGMIAWHAKKLPVEK